MRPTAVVFDWDNTLADGWLAIQAGLNAAFRHFAMPEWTMTEVLANTRKSMRESFPTLFGERWEEARDHFMQAVRAEHLKVLRPLDGTAAMLAVARDVAPLGVVSNKQGPLLRAEIAHLGWDDFFHKALGAGDLASDKPDPAPIHAVLDACGVRPGPDAWYVGDTALDMVAARNAGVTAVLLGDASHDGGLSACNPDMHFADAKALAEYLRSVEIG
ncbi:HAD family hydrolase [Rhodovarius crocodyli]|uniref:HAD family hydrolase n=1 Tax=Rhodovarius crocodyli TaxID=1979269 RepID=UPI001F0BC644|nr:HAD family hydrolase [Rhodovarius crocodyli]